MGSAFQIRGVCSRASTVHSDGSLRPVSVQPVVISGVLSTVLLVFTRIGPGFSGSNISALRVLSCILTCD